ncbi:hypothetical protein ACHWQZ_G003872 [Mnemiopsis leidyi]
MLTFSIESSEVVTIAMIVGEESLMNGFNSCKRNIAVITKLVTFLTIFVLFGISLGLLSIKHYPLLAVYALFIGLLMLIIELVLPLLSKVDTTQQPNISWWKEKSILLCDLLTPMKKCVAYSLAGLPLFLHLTLAVLGAMFLLITALFLAGQYDDSQPGDYTNLQQDDGPIGGISAGDTVRPGDPSHSLSVDLVAGNEEEETGDVMTKSDNVSGWDMMKDDVNDDDLLLG